MNKLLILTLLLFLSGCSFFGGGEDKKSPIKTNEPLVIEKDFLWERVSEEEYIAFASDMRCAVGDFPGYTDEQLKILSDEGLTPEKYDYEGARPDWFTEYAKTGLDEKVQVATNSKCPEKL